MAQGAAPVRLCDISDMTVAPDPLLYRQLMAVRPANMTSNQWLLLAGVNRSFFTDLRKRGRARSDIVEKLIVAAGLTPQQFYAQASPDLSIEAREDEERARELPFRRLDEVRDVPLLGTAMGADFEIREGDTVEFAEITDIDLEDVVDTLRRPPALRGRSEVYALNVVGSSMSPRYDPGDPVYIDPKATPRIGDDVVVYLLRPDDQGEARVVSVLIKRLVRITARLVELQQFNPGVSFIVPREEVRYVQRVIPWRELTNF